MDDSILSHLSFRIRFRGLVSARWLSTLQSATLSTERFGRKTETTIVGEAPDEAALVGVINMIYDLGGSLISVESASIGVANAALNPMQE